MSKTNSIIPTEESEQAALFDWAGYSGGKYPELSLLYAIPNGGYRHKKTAHDLQRTGLKAGVPDICLPVARGMRHGLYVEMKRQQHGVVSAHQKIWLEALKKEGYEAVVCFGWEEAKGVIIAYLEGK